MAQLIIAAAGAHLGAAVFGAEALFLGVTGKGIGFVAGSMLGAALMPGMRTAGPRLDAIRTTAAEYEQPATVGAPE